MKICIILLIVAVLGYSEASICQITDLPKVTQTCLTREGASEIDIIDLLARKKARNDKGKCFRACMLTECEFMDDNGKVIPELAKIGAGFLSGGVPEIAIAVEKATNECLDGVKFPGNKCDYTENLFLCIVDSCKDCKVSIPKLT
ncbi:general odorant-binding protein 28a-like [Haematobia irritans]|uniref:general odorant-binding protein 28a-like n=1 Tax=Haematobia irritans TaxID=7368 RepID=UPI003F50B82E